VFTDTVTELAPPVSFDVFRAVTVKINVTWDVMLCSLVSTLKIEAARFSETTINVYQTTRHHIPEGNNLLFFLVGSVIES
jgi:hypothetical protein